jgi:hypothetical protein
VHSKARCRPTNCRPVPVRGSGAAQIPDLSEVLAFQVELLEATVLAVGNIEDVVLVNDDGVRNTELGGTGAMSSPLANPFARRGVFEHTGVAVAVADENAVAPGEGDVRGPVEALPIGYRRISQGDGDVGLAADLDAYQFLAVRGVFEDSGAGGVDSPDGRAALVDSARSPVLISTFWSGTILISGN